MANDPTALVEQHLQMMTEISVEDEATARQALAGALSAAGGMNQHLAAAQLSFADEVAGWPGAHRGSRRWPGGRADARPERTSWRQAARLSDWSQSCSTGA